MADTFLALIADDVYGTLGGTLASSLVIFPNKRPASYMHDALKKLGCPEDAMPTCATMDDFIQEQSGYSLADKVDLLVILFKVYQKYYPGTEFHTFYGWGNVMLEDFEDIDRYMTDAAQLFKNVSAIKDLEKYFLEEVNELADEFLSPLNPDDQYYLEERSKEI